MNDQELLTYAAKAMGYEFKTTDLPEAHHGLWLVGKRFHTNWNPLVSGDDAFELMVKLQLTVMNEHISSNTVTVENERLNISVCEESVYENGDEITSEDYAATRRAIVRAAAEIGKGM